ncbi:MAG: SIS domain-containing protein [Hyphomicrobiaceae bacterium]
MGGDQIRDMRGFTEQLLDKNIRSQVEALQDLRVIAGKITQTFRLMRDSLDLGHKLIFAGNGGAAALSEHIVAELVGRLTRARPPLAALALTVNGASLTALSNDFGFQCSFARQIEALGRKGDVLVVITLSAASPNLELAVQSAKDKGMFTVILTRKENAKWIDYVDSWICVGEVAPQRAQEIFLLVLHTFCEALDEMS